MNPRFQHTFVDEDAMRWVKGNLDSLQFNLPMHVASCSVWRVVQTTCCACFVPDPEESWRGDTLGRVTFGYFDVPN